MAGVGDGGRADERKWRLIGEISLHGDPYGNFGGVGDFLGWCGKSSTQEATAEEAEAFLRIMDEGGQSETPGVS